MGVRYDPPGLFGFIWSSLDTFHCITRNAPAGFAISKELNKCKPNNACTCDQPIINVTKERNAQRDLKNHQKKINSTNASTIKGNPTPSIATYQYRPGDKKPVQHTSKKTTTAAILDTIKNFLETFLKIRVMLKITTHLRMKHAGEYLFLHR